MHTHHWSECNSDFPGRKNNAENICLHTLSVPHIMTSLQSMWVKVFHCKLHSVILLPHQISGFLLILATQAIVIVDSKK